MDTQENLLELTVEQILERWPQAYSVFMKHGTKCVGCFIQPFCTLKDVAETYQLSLETLIDDIKNVSHTESNQRRIL
jgi:hybrid cluster-associated redox disulfide protein